MRVEVDQSGKIEQTNQDTVLAFSNRIKRAILIPRREKRKLIKILRERGMDVKVFYPRIFCSALFILFEPHLSELDNIVIDDEYTGKTRLIKNLLNNIAYRQNKPPISSKIRFDRVGKKSPAHILAWEAKKDRELVSEKIEARQILQLIGK